MKYLWIILYLVCIINIKPLIAQINFIHDPSFEIIDSCPDNMAQLDPICRYWFTETTYMPIPPNYPYSFNNWGSSDIYNVCADFNTNFSVPYNYLGFQLAKTGVGYSGIFIIVNDNNNIRNDFKEYLETKLIHRLKESKFYYLEFFYSIPENYSNIYFPIEISALFSDTVLYRLPGVGTAQPQNLYGNPQVFAQMPQQFDDTSWIKVSGVFKAQGNEQYLTIGNFRNTSALSNYTTYIYIDEVNLYPYEPAKIGGNKYLCPKDSVLLGANDYTEYKYQWYEKDTNQLISTKGQLWVSPDSTTKYILKTTIGDELVSYDSAIVFVSYDYCDKDNKITIYPNPNKGSFVVSFDYQTEQGFELKLYDAIGKKVKDLKIENNIARKTFEIKDINLNSGIYIYELSYKNQIYKGKIVIVD